MHYSTRFGELVDRMRVVVELFESSLFFLQKSIFSCTAREKEGYRKLPLQSGVNITGQDFGTGGRRSDQQIMIHYSMGKLVG
jgi:hypothetical protein